MSCNEKRSNQNEQELSAKEIAQVAGTALNAVVTSITGAKAFAKHLGESAGTAKGKKAAGLAGTSLGARILLGSDFVPALAQIIDRAWESAKKTDALPTEEVTEECAEAVAEEPVEEPVAEEAPAEFAAEDVLEEAAPVMAETTDADEDNDDDNDNDSEEEPFAGISMTGLDFFDAKAEAEAYAELLEQEHRGEIRIVTRYRRSFLSRLVQSQGDVQVYYSEIKNKLLSYKGIKGRISWGNESFNKGRTYVAKVNAKSKTLYLYLALDPEVVASLEEGKYNIVDMSSKKKYENVPTLIKVKGPRKLKHALELIDLLCRDTLELRDVKNFEAEDYTVPYQTTEELVDLGAVKMMVAGIPMEDAASGRPEDVDVTAVEA